MDEGSDKAMQSGLLWMEEEGSRNRSVSKAHGTLEPKLGLTPRTHIRNASVKWPWDPCSSHLTLAP